MIGLSVGALVLGGLITAWFALWIWRIIGAAASVETLGIGVVVVIAVAALYGALPPLFGFMTTGAPVIVAGILSFVLLRVLF